MDLREVLTIEESNKEDVFRVKRMYIDIAEDLNAGILLGQIAYWYLPGENGESKLRVRKDNKLWIAKKRGEWYKEVRLTAKQVDRAIKILEQKKLIVKKIYKFNKNPTHHIRLTSYFVKACQQYIAKNPCDDWNLPKGKNEGFPPKGKVDFPQRVNSITEITNKNNFTENTKKGFITDKTLRDSKKDSKKKSAAFPIKSIEVQELLENYPNSRENVEYYLNKYKAERNQEHPNLKLEQWKRVFEEIIWVVDDDPNYGFRDAELMGDNFKDVVDKHFETNYQEGCDYNILHFISGRVMINRYYEAVYR